MEVGALRSPDAGAPFRYLEHAHTTHRKFLEATEVEAFAKKQDKPGKSGWEASKFLPEFA